MLQALPLSQGVVMHAQFVCDCGHSQNSNGGTLKEAFSCFGPASHCIQNEFIIDSPCCCSEHTLATNEEMTVCL